MKRLILLLVVLVFVSGCAVTKFPVATGGSKADATVEMSYTYNAFESPEVDWASAKRDAERRCFRWGYESASAFGGSMTRCINYNQYGCNSWQVTTEYACEN